MRELVTLREVTHLFPIEGADFIEIAQIDGWQCIVKKGEFQVGSKGIYFEIDSFLPLKECYAFLKDVKSYKGKLGYRIKTMKMRKVVSQGLLLPLSFFKETLDFSQPLAEQLEVIKYDNQDLKEYKTQAGANKGRSFPHFIPKTDQERIENLPTYFEIYKDTEFEETLKLDGSSLTAYKIIKPLTKWEKLLKFIGVTISPIHFGVCSRNLELTRNANKTYFFDNNGKTSEYSQSAFWRVAKKYELEYKVPVNFAVQGEFIAPNIQSNHEKVEEEQFYCFSVYNISNGYYLLPEEARKFCLDNGIPYVPVLRTNTKVFSEVNDVQELRKRVAGMSMNKGTISEGRVYKSVTNGNIHFKCINPEYLLKCEE